MQIKNVTIGADIELFLSEKKTGNIVSAEGYIQGTKDNPFNFDVANKYFAVSLDNVLAEFCIPPAKNKEEFYKNILHSVGYINKSIPKDLCTIVLPAACLEERFLQTAHAKLFGCEPDYNAYTGKVNPKPCANDHTLRSAGGHVHIGYDNPNEYMNREIIKALDLHVGIPSIIQEPDNKRKELYGKAGAFRHKEYGVEYRTISNYYLQSKALTLWVFDAIQNALNWLNDGNTLEPYMDDVIQETINGNDKSNAEAIIMDFKLKLAI